MLSAVAPVGCRGGYLPVIKLAYGGRQKASRAGADSTWGNDGREKTGVSDVPKTFWKAAMARGKSTTTAKHVRDPTGQPKGLVCIRADASDPALSTQRAKPAQCLDLLNNPSKALMPQGLWQNIELLFAESMRG